MPLQDEPKTHYRELYARHRGLRGKTSDNDNRGLRSIRPFCDGKGRLDDFRDIVQDVYLQRSGRGMTVSV